MTEVLAAAGLVLSVAAVLLSLERRRRDAYAEWCEARARLLNELADQCDRLLAARVLLEHARWVARKERRRG